jgi:hypothetical protein
MSAALRQLAEQWRTRGQQLTEAAAELSAVIPTITVSTAEINLTEGVTRDEVAAALGKQTSALPTLGALFHGGTYAGITTSKTGEVYALVLLADKPAGELNWKDAQAWAKKLGADVPNRVESAMLFANLPDAFQKEWHWTSEQASDAAYAWYQLFNNGYQTTLHKSYEGRVRAVRRLPLNPSTIEVQA